MNTAKYMMKRQYKSGGIISILITVICLNARKRNAKQIKRSQNSELSVRQINYADVGAL